MFEVVKTILPLPIHEYRRSDWHARQSRLGPGRVHAERVAQVGISSVQDGIEQVMQQPCNLIRYAGLGDGGCKFLLGQLDKFYREHFQFVADNRPF